MRSASSSRAGLWWGGRRRPPDHHAWLLMAVVLALAACQGSATPTTDAAVSESTVDTSTTAAPTEAAVTSSTVAESTTTTTVPFPSTTVDYGIYADTVLHGGRVPRGSPEHIDFLVNCLREAGFSVQVEEGYGHFSAQVPEGQSEAYDEAGQTCREKAETSGLVGTEPWDEDDLRIVYRALTEVVQACLEEHGFTTVEPPSMERFVSDYANVNWNPWIALGASREAADQVCTPSTGPAIIELGRRDAAAAGS